LTAEKPEHWGFEKYDNDSWVDAFYSEDIFELLREMCTRFVPHIIDDDDKWRKMPSWEWKCRWLKCDWGNRLAGADSCYGDPTDKDCPEFTTKYSDCQSQEDWDRICEEDEQTGGGK
jgi:hypothetical protein